ncbi:thymidine phosphorylase [Rhodobacteraceae bacterium CCMM004]|nr:thymidine phosphorylase [Rhodobacteraceae bacterium CCMM004]
MDLRDGRAPDPEAIAAFARGLADGGVSDAQAGAFAMAVCVNGLGPGGAVALTEAMRDSGEVMRWDLPGPAVDKHSTGGIGDTVSLPLAPALACEGVYVPMVSGRGLGHTGGTLDKLEAIPGLSTEVPPDRFRALVAELGFAIVAASSRIAPADRRLYAVRDVTGTVESVDLITASILSKKLAAGLDALVLDVKAGSGAFMASDADAARLARSLVETATGAGCPTAALITDMDQPLAPAAGNAVEVAAAMEIMTDGRAEGPMAELTAALGGALLHLAGAADSAEDGAARIAGHLRSGAAAERFAAMVAALGGPRDFAKGWRDALPAAPVVRDVAAAGAGHVAAIDGRALGLAVVRLGGGRQVESDRIDPAVGLTHLPRLGDRIDAGAPLARVHARSEDAADRAAAEVAAAIRLAPEAPALHPLIRDRL